MNKYILYISFVLIVFLIVSQIPPYNIQSGGRYTSSDIFGGVGTDASTGTDESSGIGSDDLDDDTPKFSYKKLMFFVLGIIIIVGVGVGFYFIGNSGCDKEDGETKCPECPSTTCGNLSTEESNGIRAFATTCIDLRFIDEQDKFLEEKFGKNAYDYYVVPGPSLALLRVTDNQLVQDDDTEEDYVDKVFYDAWMASVKISRLVHNITKIVLIDHEDCSYYKKNYTTKNGFDNDYADNSLDDDEKMTMQTDNMSKVVRQLAKELANRSTKDIDFKGLEVYGYYMNKEGKTDLIIKTTIQAPKTKT